MRFGRSLLLFVGSVLVQCTSQKSVIFNGYIILRAQTVCKTVQWQQPVVLGRRRRVGGGRLGSQLTNSMSTK
jgi:hypothetical protein